MADTDYQQQWEITEAMIRFGGGFVFALGRLYRTADADNQARLRRAFPEYWAEYATLVPMLKAREAK